MVNQPLSGGKTVTACEFKPGPGLNDIMWSSFTDGSTFPNPCDPAGCPYDSTCTTYNEHLTSDPCMTT